LISSSKKHRKKFYFLDDVIDNAKDILMVEDENVISKYENKKIEDKLQTFFNSC
jgi:two-component system, OmpR family, sensor kinase